MDERFVIMPPTNRAKCPECASEKFQLGPRCGRWARNVRCENGHEWNVTPFGWQDISAGRLKNV